MISNCQVSRFFQRTVSVVGEDPPAMERFIIDFDAYTKSIILEAEDRVANHQRTVNDYLILRRDTCGAKPTFSFFGLGLNIPNSVFDNPLMISIIENATDLIAITNVSHTDLCGNFPESHSSHFFFLKRICTHIGLSAHVGSRYIISLPPSWKNTISIFNKHYTGSQDTRPKQFPIS